MVHEYSYTAIDLHFSGVVRGSSEVLSRSHKPWWRGGSRTDGEAVAGDLAASGVGRGDGAHPSRPGGAGPRPVSGIPKQSPKTLFDICGRYVEGYMTLFDTIWSIK